jgi:hypothetical protein
MQEISINWGGLIVAVVVKQAIGGVWFSSVGFGRRWSALTGVSAAEMRARLPKVLPMEIVAAFIMAFVLVHAIRYAGGYGALSGSIVGFMNWLGFVAVTALNAVLYANRSLALYLIDMGYWLVSLVVMGAILGVAW